jgi:hypothetical protein
VPVGQAGWSDAEAEVSGDFSAGAFLAAASMAIIQKSLVAMLFNCPGDKGGWSRVSGASFSASAFHSFTMT